MGLYKQRCHFTMSSPPRSRKNFVGHDGDKGGSAPNANEALLPGTQAA